MSFFIRLTEYGLYLTLLVSLLMFGAGFVEGYALLGFLTLCLGASLLSQEKFQKSFFLKYPTSPVFFILMAWFLFLCLQIVPLSVPFARVLSPKLVELYQKFGSASLAGAGIPLSIAWEDALATLLKHGTYVALFFISYGLIRDKTALKRLNVTFVFIALFISLLGLISLRMSPGTIYGVFRFEHSTPLTPYLNKNHFANLLVMTLPITLGLLLLCLDRSSFSSVPSIKQKILWFSSREATFFLVLAGIFVIELAALLRASSRGGVLGLAGGLCAFMVLLLMNRRKPLVVFVLLALIAVGSFFAVKQIHPLLYKLRLLRTIHQDYALSFRLSNWLDTLRIFFDFSWVGTGAGSFGRLFPLYKSIPEKGIFTQTRFFYTENEFLQGLSEMGILGSGLLAVFFIVLTVSFVSTWRKTSSKTTMWLGLGMASGSFGMLVHSFVDYPMHIPANMALFAVLGGALFRLGLGEDDTLAPQRARSLAGVLAKAVAGVLILVVITPLLWRHCLSERAIRKANEHLNLISKEERIFPAPILAAYQELLEERQLDAREKSDVAFALGKVYAYLGFLRKENARIAWFQKSEEAFRRAIKRYPFNAAYHYMLGWLYQQWEKPEQASPFLKNALDLEPQNPFYRFKFGENEAVLGNTEIARKNFQETVEININYIEPILNILTRLPTETTLEEFELLLPENENRSAVQDRIVRFFAMRKEDEKAEALRQFMFTKQVRS